MVNNSRSTSRRNSKTSSGSEPNPTSEKGSTNGSNLRSKYMENVLSSNSEQSLQKQRKQGSRIGTSVEQRSRGSEKPD